MRQSDSEKPVFLFNGTQGIRINLSDVVYAISEHNHCTVVMADGTHHRLSYQLGQLEENICLYGCFVRIHRQTLINIWHVSCFINTLLIMDNGSKLNIGRTYEDVVKSHFIIISKSQEK